MAECCPGGLFQPLINHPCDGQREMQSGEYLSFPFYLVNVEAGSGTHTTDQASPQSIMSDGEDVILPSVPIKGTTIFVKNINQSSTLTISTAGQAEIDASPTLTLLLNEGAVLVANGKDWWTHQKASGGGGGGGGEVAEWILVETKTISVKTSSFDFDAVLDGDNDGGYKVIGQTINDEGTGFYLRMRFNGAEWAVTRQFLFATGTSVSALRDTTNYVSYADPGETGQFWWELPVSKSGFGGRWSYSRGSPGAIGSGMDFLESYFDITTPANTANITSIGIVSDTDIMGVGSVYRLYKQGSSGGGGGGGDLSVDIETGSITTDDDNDIICSNPSGDVTITLHTAATAAVKPYTIQKIDSDIVGANEVVIDPDGSETIDGESTITLYVQYDFITIVPDGTNWKIISDGRIPHRTRVRRTTAQSIPSGVSTAISFTVEDDDVGGIGTVTSTTPITIKRAGQYSITGYSSVATNLAATKALQTAILINGVREIVTQIPGDGARPRAYVGLNMDLSVSDTVGVGCFQNSGGNLNTETAVQHIQPQLSVTEIRR